MCARYADVIASILSETDAKFDKLVALIHFFLRRLLPACVFALHMPNPLRCAHIVGVVDAKDINCIVQDQGWQRARPPQIVKVSDGTATTHITKNRSTTSSMTLQWMHTVFGNS